MIRTLCQCGHAKEVHNVMGQACIGCDCRSFVVGKVERSKKPRVSAFVKALTKKMNMSRRRF